jgi:hypothetical protein
MNLRYSKLLAIAGTLIMLALELVFYSSRNKELTYSWVRAVGFPAVWAGTRLFTVLPLREEPMSSSTYILSRA